MEGEEFKTPNKDEAKPKRMASPFFTREEQGKSDGVENQSGSHPGEADTSAILMTS
jgi:hypothetical protein